jgi:DNA invertase Pin-like site-specific DNA recombinase
MKIGYARVSTSDQNLYLQEDALLQAGCEKIFTDKTSGAKEDRPGLQEAIAYLRNGDTIVIWRLDRLARSIKHLITLVGQLNEKGIHLLSLHEGIDTSSINGTLVFHIFAALSQFERNLTRERTKAGLAAARARGRQGGRPSKLTPEQIKKLQALMKDPTLSISDLKRMFGVGKTTIYKYGTT